MYENFKSSIVNNTLQFLTDRFIKNRNVTFGIYTLINFDVNYFLSWLSITLGFNKYFLFALYFLFII